VDENCAHFCHSLAPRKGYHDFNFEIPAFNRVLSAVLAVHGSARGRQVLHQFWPVSVRHREGDVSVKDRKQRPARIVIKTAMGRDWVVYGSLQPQAQTIIMIFEQAVTEWSRSAADGKATSNAQKVESLTWTVEALMALARPLTHTEIVEQMDEVLAKHGDLATLEALPETVRQVYARARRRSIKRSTGSKQAVRRVGLGKSSGAQ
jgi:hypothetical protein